MAKITEGQIEKIKELFYEGNGSRKIAAKINLSRYLIIKTLKLLNLKHPKKYVNAKRKKYTNNQICTKCKLDKDINDFGIDNRKTIKYKKYKPICKCCEKIKSHIKHENKLINAGKITRLRNINPITEKELNDVNSLFNNNENRSTISEKLNINEQRVSKIYKILGIKGKSGTTIRVSKEEKSKNRKQRWLNDVNFRLRKLISSTIGNALKSFKCNKNNRSITNFLPYSISELIFHIENLFEPWMNWQNHGKIDLKTWNDDDQSTWKWNIDHIIPQYHLPYTSMEDDNFKKCWALSNLRPLSAKQNIIDVIRKYK